MTLWRLILQSLGCIHFNERGEPIASHRKQPITLEDIWNIPQINKGKTGRSQHVTNYVQKSPWTLIHFITHPHLLVRATSEQFLPAGSTFRHGLASESHSL